LIRIAAFGILLTVAACAEPGPGSQPDPTGVAWELMGGTMDGDELTLVETHPITLTIEDDAASGTAACNRYFASVAISGAAIGFDGLGATEMACSPEEVMESERGFLAALSRVSEFSATEESLTLTGEGVELVFSALPPVPTAELTGTVWVLESLVDGDSVSSVMGERATLELYTDGSMLGSTGCRSLHGRYEVVGAEVSMVEMAADGECPAALQGQDAQVVSVLGDGFRAAIDGDRLTLTSAGSLGLVYRAVG
jgi:heat shock protein HslJ